MEKVMQTDIRLPLSNKTAAVLIRRVQDGDKSALAILYDGTHPLVFGLILKILQDQTQAEETLLDVYMYVWKQAASYDSKLPPLEWLLMIARAQAVTKLHWRKRDRKKREFLPGDAQSAMTVAPDRQRLVRSVLASLAPNQREILEWAYYSGLSSSEIAAQTGKPIGAIRTHARLGMSKLCEMFRPLIKNDSEMTGGRIEARIRD